MWKILVAVLLAAHGIGHIMILFPAAKKAKDTSWLLSKPLGEAPARLIVTAIWMVALLGFVAAALGVYNIIVPDTAWRTIAIASAFVSLAGIVLSLRAYPIGQAVVADILIIAALWIFNWPTVQMIGS